MFQNQIETKRLFGFGILVIFFLTSGCSSFVTVKREDYLNLKEGAQVVVVREANGEALGGELRELSKEGLLLAHKKGSFKHLRIKMEPFDRRTIEKGELVTVSFRDDVQVEGRVEKIELEHITLSDYTELRQLSWSDVNSIKQMRKNKGRELLLTISISAAIIVGAILFIDSGFGN